MKGSRSRKGRLWILSNSSARFPPREDIPETEPKQLFGSRGWHPLNLQLSELKSTQVFPPRQQTHGMSRFIDNVFFKTSSFVFILLILHIHGIPGIVFFEPFLHQLTYQELKTNHTRKKNTGTESLNILPKNNPIHGGGDGCVCPPLHCRYSSQLRKAWKCQKKGIAYISHIPYPRRGSSLSPCLHWFYPVYAVVSHTKSLKRSSQVENDLRPQRLGEKKRFFGGELRGKKKV